MAKDFTFTIGDDKKDIISDEKPLITLISSLLRLNRRDADKITVTAKTK